MKKAQLLKLPILKATAHMMKLAADDELQYSRVKVGSYGNNEKGYKYGLYLRCKVFDNILKVAVFYPEHMRSGGRLPVFEVYVDRQDHDFITYNHLNKKWMTSKLNMIEWPKYVFYSETKWISPSDGKLIQTYLGVEHTGYRGVLDFQMQVRLEELKRRHKKETDPWDLAMEQTPDLPKDWEQWVSKVGIPENFIFYKYVRGGAKTGYCTYCEKEVPIRNPKHNKLGTCPVCRHKIQYKSEGRAGTVITPTVNFYLIQRCEDGFMVRNFHGRKRFEKYGYRTPYISIWEIRRAICNKNAIPLSAYYWGDYKHSEIRWIATGFCHANWWGGTEGRVYGKTLPDLAKHELKKTGLVEFIKQRKVVDPEKYLAVLRYIPQMEQIVKADFPRLVSECLKDYYNFAEVFKSKAASSLTKLFGLDNQQLKRLRANNGGRSFIRWLRNEKVMGKEIPDNIISWLCENSIVMDDLRFILDRMSVVQIYNYVCRQSAELNMKPKDVIGTWADYLSMAARLKMDTNDAIIYRVRMLKKRHDELVERCKLQDMEIRAGEVLLKYPHIEDIYDSIRSLYAYEDKTYSVLIPSKLEEIIKEGEQLHHCVGSSERYWDRIERRESYVLFLRHTSEPDKPYYTLEVEPDGTVRQKRTMYDRQEPDIELAKKFLRQWQRVVSTRLTATERKLAVVSQELRMQEFEELKREKVIIHTGDFHGRSLLDLLTEDLMENTNVVAEPVLAAAA